MNNFEKIKQMTVEEMANWLDNVSEECSDMCIASLDDSIMCYPSNCRDNIKQWLLQEVEE
jgi:wobble nucleotide-excising tRNase